MSLFVMLMSIMTFAQQVKPEVVVSKHTFIVHSTTHSLFSDDKGSSKSYNHIVKFTNNGQSAEFVIGD